MIFSRSASRFHASVLLISLIVHKIFYPFETIEAPCSLEGGISASLRQDLSTTSSRVATGNALAGAFSYTIALACFKLCLIWIPAYAGMTGDCALSSFPRKRESRPRSLRQLSLSIVWHSNYLIDAPRSPEGMISASLRQDLSTSSSRVAAGNALAGAFSTIRSQETVRHCHSEPSERLVNKMWPFGNLFFWPCGQSWRYGKTAPESEFL